MYIWVTALLLAGLLSGLLCGYSYVRVPLLKLTHHRQSAKTELRAILFSGEYQSEE